jgi:hypothetical protein
MKPRAKVAIVCAGYGLAVVASCAAGWAYDARVSQLPYDTSGGMYAEGESLTHARRLFCWRCGSCAKSPVLAGVAALRSGGG